MAAGSGRQWETTVANGKGRWQLTVMGGSSGGNGQWRLAKTSGGSRCRQIMRVMEKRWLTMANDGGRAGGSGWWQWRAVTNSGGRCGC